MKGNVKAIVISLFIVTVQIVMEGNGSVAYADDSSEAIKLQKILEAAPAWSTIDRGPKLIIALEHCIGLKEATVKMALTDLLSKQTEEGPPVEAWSKIYILLRIYFAVPEWEKRSAVKFFGGWVGVPEQGGSVNIIWPLKIKPNGHFYITSEMGGYMGANYKALEEFDYFSKRYGVRQLSK